MRSGPVDPEAAAEGGDRLRPRLLLFGPALGLALHLLLAAVEVEGTGFSPPERATVAVTATVAVWWIGRACAIGAASLLPFVALPLFGVLPVAEAAKAYFHPILFLFLGGFLLALAIEKWGLHRRIAFGILRRAGTSPRGLLLGFLVATAFLSLWISNTATTLLMLPIVLAVVRGFEEGGARPDPNFAFALLLGVAYAASVGGLGTPVGTAPNAIFLGQFRELFPEGPAIPFARWMLAMIPLVALLLVGIWLVLLWIAPPRPVERRVLDAVREQGRALGRWTSAERRVAILFGLAALLWVFRGPIRLGETASLPGWSELLGPRGREAIDDSTVAIGVALLAFLLPSGAGPRRPLLDWETARRVPWDILLLLGSGIALASAFESSGLSLTLGRLLEPLLGGAPPLLLVGGIVVLTTALSELASNAATAQILMPLLAGVAIATRLHPMLLMLPAALAASCGFMLPIATPPNAIVFASGRIPVGRMARVGLLVDLLGIVLVTAAIFLWTGPRLGLEGIAAPAWAGGR